MSRYLVVEPQALVAEDLADCIREAAPDAEVAVALTLADGLRRLEAAPPHVAFVSAALLEGAAAVRLDALASRVVPTGSTPPGGGIGLDLPFSCDTVREVLRRIAGPQGAPPR